jgi:phosphate starvation-inducible PhoH-like protein
MSKKKNGDKTVENFFSALTNPQHVLSIKTIDPLTDNQKKMFELFAEGHNLFVHGYAGTGKTLLSLYLGLTDVLSNQTVRDNITIVRSVVPSRDMGFLPGNAKEKAKVYELPYTDACAELMPGNGNSYELMKSKGIINFTTTSFLRGLTFKNSVIYIDEIQNMCDSEIHTIMTRIGEGCRLIVSGDLRQTDLQREAEKLGCMTFIKTMERMTSFKHVEFGIEDILRSSFVKDYIIARAEVLDAKG